jgi:hypothetical protein
MPLQLDSKRSEFLWFQQGHSQIDQKGQSHEAANDINGAHASPPIIRSKASMNQTEEKHSTKKMPKQASSNMTTSSRKNKNPTVLFNNKDNAAR